MGFCSFLTLSIHTQEEIITTASSIEIYKTIGEIQLKAWIFNPPDHKSTDARAAIVFYFGGGWRSGSPKQFEKHCQYFASRGIVAIAADYRVSSRHGVKGKDCVADAKSAIRWLRKNAGQLGISPTKIVASGGSAGGHLAASTALLPLHNDPEDDLSVSCIPDALALFNPALILSDIEEKIKLTQERKKSLRDRMGADGESMSPYHHLQSDMPPCIIFHGTGDTTVDFETAEVFVREAIKLGNRCILYAYKDETHGFFNYGRKKNGAYVDTVNKLDQFLVSLGFLDSAPEVQVIE